MAGMTTTGLPKLSDYSDRNVVIEVTGLCRQDVMKTSNYQVKVPFSRMSQTMQTIHRMGGKVSSVSVDSLSNGNAQGEE
ncbi:MAG: phycobilisome linker polypeptide [Calothrix sp. MO_192.B10]|nr:phycobilisome linker polypeptide [Calothrix sp. MO_192.B10]